MQQFPKVLLLFLNVVSILFVSLGVSKVSFFMSHIDAPTLHKELEESQALQGLEKDFIPALLVLYMHQTLACIRNKLFVTSTNVSNLASAMGDFERALAED